MIATHDEKLKEISQKLLKTQEQNAQLSSENAAYKKQVDILLEKNETMQYVEDMQTDEIARLKAMPAEHGKVIEASKMIGFTERIDNISLQLEEKKTENQKLVTQLEIVTKEKQQRLNLLQNEITALKDQL